MTPIHVACRQPSTFKIIIADDGLPALVRWCATCAIVLATEELDPPIAIDVEDVPAEAIAQLWAVTNPPSGAVN